MSKLLSSRKEIVTVQKNPDVEKYRTSVKKELELISEYKKVLICACAFFDVLLLIPILRAFGSYIQGVWYAWVFLGALCFLANYFIDNALIDFYWEIAKKEGLDITEKWKSGSMEKFKAYVKEDIRKQLNLEKNAMFSIYNVDMKASEYICEVIVWE